jgi:SAM-dependent methyltransferase
MAYMQVACVMMQKDEDYLLGPWLAYHGELFGFKNLLVLDNGSQSSKTLKILDEFERRGVTVVRNFSSKADYERKGDIVAHAIRSLDATGAYDFVFPLDCDEFIVKRTPWGFTFDALSIKAYLASLRNETRVLRVPFQLANNPFDEDFYIYFRFHKTFFVGGTFQSLDHGYHDGKTKSGGVRVVDLIYMHFHYVPYFMLRERAARKWVLPINPTEALATPGYTKRSVHLIPYFSMSEEEYRASISPKVQFFFPAFRKHLSGLGWPILVPRDQRGGDTKPLRELCAVTQSDERDAGEATCTALFIPSPTLGGLWTKGYLNEREYLRRNPDVANAGLSAIRHFCDMGFEKGRVLPDRPINDADIPEGKETARGTLDSYRSLFKQHLDNREFRVLNALKCLRIVRPLIPFQSVVDFGCGIGGWLVAAKRLGAEKVLGIEGEWIRTQETLLDADEIQIADLATERVYLNRSFDLAVSIEVGEHLPPHAADQYCDSLVDASNILIFSAAVPGQGGVNHLNEQPPRYWVDKFWQRGFVPLEIIRPAIGREPKMYSWLQRNVIMFINYDLLHIHLELARFALPRQHFYINYQAM